MGLPPVIKWNQRCCSLVPPPTGLGVGVEPNSWLEARPGAVGRSCCRVEADGRGDPSWWRYWVSVPVGSGGGFMQVRGPPDGWTSLTSTVNEGTRPGAWPNISGTQIAPGTRILSALELQACGSVKGAEAGPINAKSAPVAECWPRMLPRQGASRALGTTTKQPKPVSSKAAADWRGGLHTRESRWTSQQHKQREKNAGGSPGRLPLTQPVALAAGVVWLDVGRRQRATSGVL